MITLDVNTNGAWRRVLAHVPDDRMDEVRHACLVLVRINPRIKFQLHDSIRTVAMCKLRPQGVEWGA